MKVNEILFFINFILASKIIDSQLVFVAGSPPSLAQSFIPHLITASWGRDDFIPTVISNSYTGPIASTTISNSYTGPTTSTTISNASTPVSNTGLIASTPVSNTAPPPPQRRTTETSKVPTAKKTQKKELFLKKYFLKRLMSK